MKRQFHFPSLALVLALGAFSGCASLDPKPFNDFSSSVDAAQSGMTTTLLQTQVAARNSLIKEMAENPKAAIGPLQIISDGKYKWHYAKPDKDQPLYLRILQTETALEHLNEVFSSYAKNLATLAGGGTTDSAEFNTLASDLNANVTKITNDLDLQGGSSVAIFSTGATALFEQYINSKRKEALREALEKNQDTVVRYSKLCVGLINTLRQITQTFYNISFNNYNKEWKANAVIDRRSEIITKTLTLNEGYANSLKVLKQIEDSLTTIPNAHADLIKSLEAPNGPTPAIQELMESGKRLQELYQQVKSN
jgi:hypothetical protein